MQGERHDIEHEFPELHERLFALRAADSGFAELVDRHDALDRKIRGLEERQSPIEDGEFEKLKFERTALKDEIYRLLRGSAAAAAEGDQARKAK